MTITAAVVQGILLTFALMVILMPSFITLLKRAGFGKRIREEGPATHYVKEGTPTMGGVLMIAVMLFLPNGLLSLGRLFAGRSGDGR